MAVPVLHASCQTWSNPEVLGPNDRGESLSWTSEHDLRRWPLCFCLGSLAIELRVAVFLATTVVLLPVSSRLSLESTEI